MEILSWVYMILEKRWRKKIKKIFSAVFGKNGGEKKFNFFFCFRTCTIVDLYNNALKTFCSFAFHTFRNQHPSSNMVEPAWIKSSFQMSKRCTPNVGLDPTTLGLRVPCSTDWVSRAICVKGAMTHLKLNNYPCYSTIVDAIKDTYINIHTYIHPNTSMLAFHCYAKMVIMFL